MPFFHPTKGILTEKCRFCGWQVECDDLEDGRQAEMFHEDDHEPDYCAMCKPNGKFGGARLSIDHSKACLEAAYEREAEVYRELANQE